MENLESSPSAENFVDYTTDDYLSEFNLDGPMSSTSYMTTTAKTPRKTMSTAEFFGTPSRRDKAGPSTKTMGTRKSYVRPPLQNETVFPNMKIPIRMQQRTKSGGRAGASKSETERKPVMAVQCPLPGGTTVTMTTDPVQKVSWGPLTRVEASQEARDLVRQYIASNEDKDISDEKRNHIEDQNGGNEKETKDEKTKEKDAGKTPTSVQAPEQSNSNDNDTATTVTGTSATEADANGLTSRIPRPPPPTPPDSIFRHALSMPTLPVLNRISDVNLVEQYRLQRAADPEAFDKETAAIKQGLVNAKLARGGRPRLLKNEYTVELASREDAATAERWAQGRIVQMRSRGNTLTNPPAVNADEIKIRGGEVEDHAKDTGKPNKKGDGFDHFAFSEAELQRLATSQAPPMLAYNIEDGPEQTSQTKTSEKTAVAGSSLLDKARKVRDDIKDRLQAVDLSSHVSKVTSYGTVRHQSSVKREVGDHGEKRTVKTWIEITEVYEVPNAAAFEWSDVVAALDADEVIDNADAKKRKALGAYRNAKGKSKAHRGGLDTKNRSPSMKDIDSEDNDPFDSLFGDSEGEPLREPIILDPDESRAESLLRSLSRFGRVTPGGLTRKMESLRGIMAELRGKKELKESAE